MSQEQLPALTDQEAPYGTVIGMHPQHIAQYWSGIEGLLRTIEKWTLLLSAEDIHVQLLDGRMVWWSILMADGKSAYALTQIKHSARGLICTLWLIAADNCAETTVFALVNRCEGIARSQGCIALEINALPHWADKIVGRVTAITVERDLRPERNEVN